MKPITKTQLGFELLGLRAAGRMQRRIWGFGVCQLPKGSYVLLRGTLPQIIRGNLDLETLHSSIYLYIHIYIYIYTYTHTHTYIYMYIINKTVGVNVCSGVRLMGARKASLASPEL